MSIGIIEIIIAGKASKDLYADWRKQTLLIFSWQNFSSVFNYECLYAQDNCLFDLQETNKTQNQNKTNKTQINRQNPKIRLLKLYHVSFIACPSFVHAVFLEHSNARAVCLETEEKVHGNQNFFQQWFLCFSRKASLQWVQEHD